MGSPDLDTFGVSAITVCKQFLEEQQCLHHRGSNNIKIGSESLRVVSLSFWSLRSFVRPLLERLRLVKQGHLPG